MHEHFGEYTVRYTNLLRIALANVLSLQLQNVLTIITMSVGAFTLSATLFIGDGAMHSLWKDLEIMMGTWVTIHPQPDAVVPAGKQGELQFFSHAELEQLRQSVNSARYIEPIYSGRGLLTYKDNKIRVSLDGITSPLLLEAIYKPLLGRDVSKDAMNGFAWECYVTHSLYLSLGSPQLDDLFVKVGRSRFQVVAVTPDPPEADELFSRRLILPYILSEMLWGKTNHYTNLVVGWQAMGSAEETLREVRNALDKARGAETYFLSSSIFKLQKRKEIVKSFVIFGNTQALFSIIVASIGILNVMLANVVHKMREFAIRITLGASRKDIFFIVVSESLCYALLGSSLGVVLSIWFSPAICTLVGQYLKDTKNLIPIISWQSILLPLAICGVCGLAAGIAPALRAVRIDILSILRSE